MADSLSSPLPEHGIQKAEPCEENAWHQPSPLPEHGIEKAEPSEENAWRQPSPLSERGNEKAEPTDYLLSCHPTMADSLSSPLPEHGIQKAEPCEENAWHQPSRLPEHGIEKAETSEENAWRQPSPLSERGNEKAEPREEENAWRMNFNRIPRPERIERPNCCLNVSGPCSNDGVAKYYQRQKEMLEGFTEMDFVNDNGVLLGMSKEEFDKLHRSETTAIRLSNIANVVLLIAKVYASIKSGSLAIIASTLDSLLDLLSGFILWFTAFKMQSPNPYRYPIGKKRMQPLGIMVFATIMATLGLEILLESCRDLVSKKHTSSLEDGKWHWVVGIMVSVTIVKLVLVIYCRGFTNEIVKAYAQDHFFDVITNAIGLIAAILASKLYWWIDPAGAIVLALYTMRTWSKTVLENVKSLVGKSASPDYLQKLTYICWNHHQDIQHIDTVKAYTLGSDYFVEVDIVLPSDMHLQQAHNIGETLQEKLESLPDIERAFVHVDYEYTHSPEHGKKAS